MKPDGTGVAQVTTDSATDRNPRWSPDGKRIAFASDRDGDFDIYVVNANGGAVVRITGTATDTVADATPSWTADGKRILFWRLPGEIWSANADGSGGEQKLADGVLPAGSPRGRKVAYSGADQHRIYVLHLNDGTTESLEGTFYDAEPNWSPNGNDLVLSGASESDDYFDTYVMHADGTQLRQLTNTDSNFQEGSPVWSPDGSRIAIATCEFSGRVQLNCSIQNDESGRLRPYDDSDPGSALPRGRSHRLAAATTDLASRPGRASTLPGPTRAGRRERRARGGARRAPAGARA